MARKPKRENDDIALNSCFFCLFLYTLQLLSVKLCSSSCSTTIFFFNSLFNILHMLVVVACCNCCLNHAPPVCIIILYLETTTKTYQNCLSPYLQGLYFILYITAFHKQWNINKFNHSFVLYMKGESQGGAEFFFFISWYSYNLCFKSKIWRPSHHFIIQHNFVWFSNFAAAGSSDLITSTCCCLSWGGGGQLHPWCVVDQAAAAAAAITLSLVCVCVCMALL